MAFYLFKGQYTPEAFKAMIAEPQDRQPAAKKVIEAIGGKLHHIFFCMGSDDVVALIEAPDDKAMAAGSMVIAASGAFSGGSTTKLMTTQEAREAMTLAQAAADSYTPATG